MVVLYTVCYLLLYTELIGDESYVLDNIFL